MPFWQASTAASRSDQDDAGPLSERSDYGARRANWPLIGFILLAHAALLAALVMFDVIPVQKVRRDPLVVTLVKLEVEPPPEVSVEKPVPVDQVAPRMAAPVQIVQPPSPAPVPVVVRDAPPSPPVSTPSGPPGPVSVGDLGTRMIAMVPPRYPIECRRRKQQGIVYLSVLLALDGSVAEVRLARSSGHERLDEAALDAVRKWRWSPTIRDGEPVRVRGTVDIPFILKV